MGVLILKIGLMASLLAIFYQDLKERAVYTWVLIVGVIAFAGLHLAKVNWTSFWITVVINTGILLLILSILFFYIKWRLPDTQFFKAIAIGDLVFLIGLALGFSTVSFVTLLVFGLVFSFIIHQLAQARFSKKQDVSNPKLSEGMKATVPLAGYLALFFTGVMLVHWLGFYEQLYLI